MRIYKPRCAIYKVAGINQVTKSTVHILHNSIHVIEINYWNHMYVTSQIYMILLSFYMGWSDLTCSMNMLWCNQWQHLHHMLFQYVPETNMHAKLHIYVTHLISIYRGVLTYMCHIWSQWHQPCDQECHKHDTNANDTYANNNNANLWWHRLYC